MEEKTREGNPGKKLNKQNMEYRKYSRTKLKLQPLSAYFCHFKNDNKLDNAS